MGEGQPMAGEERPVAGDKAPAITIRDGGVPRLHCPHCFHALVENFDRGRVECGSCGQAWELLEIVVLLARAGAEMGRLQQTIAEEAEAWQKPF